MPSVFAKARAIALCAAMALQAFALAMVDAASYHKYGGGYGYGGSYGYGGNYGNNNGHGGGYFTHESGARLWMQRAGRLFECRQIVP